MLFGHRLGLLEHAGGGSRRSLTPGTAISSQHIRPGRAPASRSSFAERRDRGTGARPDARALVDGAARERRAGGPQFFARVGAQVPLSPIREPRRRASSLTPGSAPRRAALRLGEVPLGGLRRARSSFGASERPRRVAGMLGGSSAAVARRGRRGRAAGADPVLLDGERFEGAGEGAGAKLGAVVGDRGVRLHSRLGRARGRPASTSAEQWWAIEVARATSIAL